MRGRYPPFELVPQAHAETLGIRLHAAADHQPVARLEDVERTRHGGEGHGAHEDRHVLVEAGKTKQKQYCVIIMTCCTASRST